MWPTLMVLKKHCTAQDSLVDMLGHLKLARDLVESCESLPPADEGSTLASIVDSFGPQELDGDTCETAAKAVSAPNLWSRPQSQTLDSRHVMACRDAISH
jgi:hypothetical protein